MFKGNERSARRARSASGSGLNLMQIIRASTEHLDLVAPLFDQYRVFYRQQSDLAAARKYIQERLKKGDAVIFLALRREGGGLEGLGFVQLYPSLASISMKPIWIL